MSALFDELKTIICINSYTKNKIGVDMVGEVFINSLLPLGYQLNIYDRETIGNHLHFISKSSNSNQKILLLGHLDTVFPQGSFEEYKEDDEWVYGAGVCDMKGGNLIIVQALRNIYEAFGNIDGIDVLLVSDEETGSDDSKLVTMELAKNYDVCFVFEASGLNSDIVIGRKGIGTFFVDIEGKPAHSGVRFREGIDANIEGSLKLLELAKLTDLEKGTTLNVGKIEGGVGANTISPSCRLTFEVRYTNSNERDRVLEQIQHIVSTSYVEGTKATLSGGIQRDVMQPTQSQQQLVSILNELNGAILPTEFRSGVSDANTISSCGVATIDGLGPYGDGDHTNKERALKKSFYERIELMTKVLKYHQENKRLY